MGKLWSACCPVVQGGACSRQREERLRGYGGSVSWSLCCEAGEAMSLFCLQALSVQHICLCKRMTRDCLWTD